ncbi:MAG TPA: hypothetical protein VNU02_16945 [Candidatus Dormibacteraeota bacterium]|nr:hypothetical protein [Candidatus Dormibacteraeota bacterium]
MVVVRALFVLLTLEAPATLAHAQTGAATDDSLQAWARMAEVLRHPRCLNCHPIGDAPRQADDRHLHRMLVMRGADDRGTPAMRCATCHQTVNTADGRVPGAPHWHLAPRSMGWEGLGDGELCRTLKDPARNGGRSVVALVHHMTTDPLVQWAWSPGKRPAPPVSQFEFHEAVKRWAVTGAACPS